MSTRLVCTDDVIKWIVCWFFLESRRESRGNRRGQDTFNMKRYVRNLQRCLEDARAENAKLEEERQGLRRNKQ